MLQQKKDVLYFKTSIILDTGSTFSSMHNKELITGVKKTDRCIMMKTNSGNRVIKNQVTVEGFNKKVWYDPEAHVNIFGFRDVKDQYRVTYNSAQEDAFIIHLNNKDKVKFKRSPLL